MSSLLIQFINLADSFNIANIVLHVYTEQASFSVCTATKIVYWVELTEIYCGNLKLHAFVVRQPANQTQP